MAAKKKAVVFRQRKSNVNACNGIQKWNFAHVSVCNRSSFSTNTAYNAIDKTSKKKKQK